MAESIHEMHEHAEKAREDRGLVMATFTMSLMALVVAAISVMGHRAHTRTLLDQTKATDAWAEYQARNIRRHTDQLFSDLFSIVPVKDTDHADKLKQQYTAEVERYQKSLFETRKRAENFETEALVYESKASRLDLAEVFLEAALVITSITLITHKKLFWGMGSVMGFVGVVIAISSVWVH
jgi:Domain of unknown function (DUF4337)